MSVYVDPLVEYGGSRTFRWKISCHMFSNSELELHIMAKKIGCQRWWFQDHERLPHYDLVASKRMLAIKYGAKEVSLEFMVKFMRKQNGTDADTDSTAGKTRSRKTR